MSVNKPDNAGSAPVAQVRQLDELSSSQIGKRLRSIYDEVVNEPVPDKFTNLLDSLERAEKERSNG